jgi:hypothetical protein
MDDGDREGIFKSVLSIAAEAGGVFRGWYLLLVFIINMVASSDCSFNPNHTTLVWMKCKRNIVPRGPRQPNTTPLQK